MNDEMEIIEEIQSDNIEELVRERKKDKSIQHFLTHPSSPTRYYHIINYSNGDSLKSEITPEQKRFIKGWFYRINDIGNKFGCDTIFKSRHIK